MVVLSDDGATMASSPVSTSDCGVAGEDSEIGSTTCVCTEEGGMRLVGVWADSCC